MASRQTGLLINDDDPIAAVARNLSTIGYSLGHDPLLRVLAAHHTAQQIDVIGFDARSLAIAYQANYDQLRRTNP